MADSITLFNILQSIQAGEGFEILSFRTLLRSLDSGRGRIIVEGLLREESIISSQTSDRIDPAQINYRNILQFIVQLFANLVENRDFYDEEKKTVLHYATIWGSLESVQSLLKNGANPNAKDIYGRTPLVSAVDYRHEEIVKLLIESGADVLTHDYDNIGLIHVALTADWIDFVQFLLNAGASPNHATDEDGVTPLELAVRYGQKDAIVLLIDAGVDVKGPLSCVKSILRVAVKCCSLNVLQFLVEKIDLKCWHDFRLLSYAILSQRIEKVDYLVKVLNAVNRDDDTTLNCVATMHPFNLKLIKKCVKRGDYLDFSYFNKVLRLNKVMLQNRKICTRAIVNHFNNKDLPNLFKIPMAAEKLPSIEKLTLKNSDIESIKRGVHHEIETNGHCNLMSPNVIVLRRMAVRSYLDYYDSLVTKPEKPATFDPSCYWCNNSTPTYSLNALSETFQPVWDEYSSI